MAHGPANGGVPIGIGATNKLPKWLSPVVIGSGNTNFDGNSLNIYGPTPWADIVAFGADPTGVNDSTLAIQTAINSLQPGGIVWVPVGTYKVIATLTVTTFHVQIMGASKTDCVFKTAHATNNILEFNSWYCSIQNITFDRSVTRTAGYAVKMTDTHNRHDVINCEFNNMHGGILMESHLSIVERCEFRTFVAGGSWINIACTASAAHDFQISRITGDNGSNLAGSAGILISQCASLILTTSSLSNAGANGALHINPGAGQVVPSVYCANVFFDRSGYGLNITGNATGTIQRLRFVNCWFTTSTNDGIRFNSSNALGIQGADFVNCDIHQNVNGINALAGYQDWSVSCSRFSGNTGAGVLTTALSTGGFNISNNFIGNGSGFGANAQGINIQAGTYRTYVITENRGLGTNTTKGFIDSGSITGFSQKIVTDTEGGSVRGKLAAITAATAAINTTETIIVGGLNNAPIPANSLQVGDTFRITLIGTCTVTVANISTFRIRLGTAGTTADGVILTTATLASAATGTAVPFRVQTEFTVRTLGAAATIAGFLHLVNHGTAGDVAATGISTTNTQVINGTAATFNSTVDNYIEATYQAAAATTTCTFQTAYLEKV